MDYDQLLERARAKLPEIVNESMRFEIPKVLGHIQGNRTVITNFGKIASTLQRPVEHMLKYILKELASPGELKPNGLILGTKIPASRINEKIAQYAKDFVLCPECKKPDTRLTKEDGILFIKCTACGAKRSINARV